MYITLLIPISLNMNRIKCNLSVPLWCAEMQYDGDDDDDAL